MIKSFSLILSLMLFLSFYVSAQKDFSSFIPSGYDTLDGGVARGDLNKDGIEDIALALYHKKEKESEVVPEDIPERVLIILFGTKSGYVQSIKTANPIMPQNAGGVFGDPFSGVSIAKNVLTISHYGGSAWRWYYSHKFRFQNKGWYLIGQTSGSYWNVKQCEKLNDFAGTDFEDVNLVTGQYESKKITEDCVLKENKKGKKKVLPLVSLAKFEMDN